MIIVCLREKWDQVGILHDSPFLSLSSAINCMTLYEGCANAQLPLLLLLWRHVGIALRDLLWPLHQWM